jgi:fibronectin-binding autotransporter adhesin
VRVFINILILLFISATLNAQFITNTGFMGVSSGTVISLGGDWSNSGLPNIGYGRVVFNGSVAQSINGTTTWGDLEFDNTSLLGVTISSDTQYIKGILYPTNGILTTNGLLTLLSVSGQTALIAGTNPVNNISGHVHMQRFLAVDSAWGYKHFSSPFSNAHMAQFSPYMNLVFGHLTHYPFPTFWQYHDTTSSFNDGWVEPFSSITRPDTGIMQPMVGYSANFGSDSSIYETVSLTGTVNNGNLSTNLAYNTTGSDGWNLVGNPYPSPIDWDALSGWTKTNIVDGFSIYNATGQYKGYYGCWSNATGMGTHHATPIIPSMRGFFVRATSGGGALGFSNAVRTLDLNPNPYFAKTPLKRDYKLLHLYAVESGLKRIPDDLIIYFDSSASNSAGIKKIWNTDPNIPNFYSAVNSNENFAINEFSNDNDTNLVIPIGLFVGTDDSYKIYADEIMNFPSAIKIYLQDKSTGIIQDIRQNPEYSCNISSGDSHDGRFYIIFSLKTLSNEPANNLNIFSAFMNGDELNVNYYGIKPGIMNIYNMLGQIIFQNSNIKKGINKYNLNLSNGYYLIQVVSEEKISNKKIYINNY